jgi:hypothetical protein
MKAISLAFDASFLAATAVLSVLHAMPEPVSREVTARYADMEVIEVEQDHDHGQLVYEVKLRSNTRLLEADFDAEGHFLKSDEEVLWASVPKNVQAPFAKAYPQISPTEITCVTRSHLGEDVVTYEIEFFAGGQEREMGVSAEGKVLFDRLD